MFLGAFGFPIKQLIKEREKLEGLYGMDFSHLKKKNQPFPQISTSAVHTNKDSLSLGLRSLLVAEDWKEPGTACPVLRLYLSKVL